MSSSEPLGLLLLGTTVIFGLLSVMNFAHGDLYMLGAYARIVVVGLTESFWLANRIVLAGQRIVPPNGLAP